MGSLAGGVACKVAANDPVEAEVSGTPRSLSLGTTSSAMPLASLLRLWMGNRRRCGSAGALPRECPESELEPCACVHHRGLPPVYRADDLLRRDPFQVRAGGREVGMPELALDQRQRDALVQQLDCVRMAELVWREPTPAPQPRRRGGAALRGPRWLTTRGRGSARRSRRRAVPSGTRVRSAVQSAKTDHAQGSIPTSRRRSPFPCLMSRLPRRSFRSVSASVSASWMRRPARHSTTIRPRIRRP